MAAQQPRKQSKRAVELERQLVRAEAKRDGTAANEREYTRALNAWLLYKEKE